MAIPSIFLGSWKLISAEYRGATQTAYPFGTDPIGLLIYAPDGWMSVQIMHRDYGKEIPAANPATTKNRAAFNGYLGYFGTYEFDEKNASVSHLVAGSTLAHWVGSVQHRSYEFVDEKLIFSSPATSKGEEILAVLTWVRT
jgi:hypothetical protein